MRSCCRTRVYTMKLWDTLTTCLFLLCAVDASPPLLRHRRRSEAAERLRDSAAEAESLFAQSASETDTEREAISVVKEFSMAELHPDQFEHVVDFVRVTISRIRRASSPEPAGSRLREKRRGGAKNRGGGGGGGELGQDRRRGGGGGGRKGGRGQGCVLKQVHMNVSDLGLGYKTSEEMIFKYCSGPCRNSETNYDRILNNLAHSRKLRPNTPPSHACCRPIAFDDDLAFLDDNLIYHTMKKHSARKCGCV